MKFSRVAILSFSCLSAFLSVASVHAINASQRKPSFLPQNTLKIPVSLRQQGGINEETFNRVIDKVEKIYAPIVKKAGATLKMNRDWKNSIVNAYAHREGGRLPNGDGTTWAVNMFGGLARFSIMNEDTYTLVVCHELGHHLGGFPKLNEFWPALDGQADYYASMKCMRRVFENDDNIGIVSKMNIPERVKKNCSVQFKSEKEIALCERNTMAGFTSAMVLWKMSNAGTFPHFGAGGGQKPSLDKPDMSQTKETQMGHPYPQCRLDIYVSGSACGVSYEEDFSKEKPSPGACAEEKGDRFGFRPRCWYKPQI